MAKVKVDAIHPEIAARARVLLEQHSVAEAHSAGPGVLAIYKWVLCLCLLLLHSFPYNTNSVPCLFLSHSFPCSTNSASVCSFHTRSHTIQTLSPVCSFHTRSHTVQYKLCPCLFLSHSFPYNTNSALVCSFCKYNTNSILIRCNTIQILHLFALFVIVTIQ